MKLKTRTYKYGKWDVVRTDSLLDQTLEFLDELDQKEEIQEGDDTYKKLMKEFGFSENWAKGCVKGYVNGSYLNL